MKVAFEFNLKEILSYIPPGIVDKIYTKIGDFLGDNAGQVVGKINPTIRNPEDQANAAFPIISKVSCGHWSCGWTINDDGAVIHHAGAGCPGKNKAEDLCQKPTKK